VLHDENDLSKCGAAAESVRTGKGEFNTSYGNDFLFCKEADERRRSGERSHFIWGLHHV
jgi:hypothetical protein